MVGYRPSKTRTPGRYRNPNPSPPFRLTYHSFMYAYLFTYQPVLPLPLYVTYPCPINTPTYTSGILIAEAAKVWTVDISWVDLHSLIRQVYWGRGKPRNNKGVS